MKAWFQLSDYVHDTALVGGFAFIMDPRRQFVGRLRAISALGPRSSVRSLGRMLRKGQASLSISSTELDQGINWPVGQDGTNGRSWLLDNRAAGKESWRTWEGEPTSGLHHLVALLERSGDEEDAPIHVAAFGEPLHEAIYERLKTERRAPLLPEWAEALTEALEAAGKVERWTLVGSGPEGADVAVTSAEIADILSRLLAQGAIAIPDGLDAPDVDLGTVGHIDSYIKQFGPTLGRKILGETPSRHRPGEAVPLAPLGRRLYPAQQDAAVAAVRTWEAGERTVWLIGEQGVGKTTIGLAAAYDSLGGRPGRILVHCPSHLIHKWSREVEAVIPEARVRLVRDWHDALRAIPELAGKPDGVEVWILGRDTAKLGWLWRPSAIRNWPDDPAMKKRMEAMGRAPWSCPSCGEDLMQECAAKGRTPKPWPEDAFLKRGASNTKCPKCASPLWQADPSGPRRVSPSKLWSKRLRPGTFNALLADEIHEEKGDSEQGRSIGRLLRTAKRSMLLTGTLLGGKASDLFYHLARTVPEKMRTYGYSYGNPMPFVRAYGTTEVKIRSKPGGGTVTQVMERPGIHPGIYADWLMGRAVFIELADLGANLPPYEETIITVPMAPQQAGMVTEVLEQLKGRVSAILAQGRRDGLGAYIQAALAYPDWCFTGQPVTRPNGDMLAQSSQTWDPDKLLPKEEAIIAEVLRETAKGRRCAVYATYTGHYDITERLKNQLEAFDLSVAVLTADVPPTEREDWIRRACAQGAQVLICHPRLVATGLDLTGETNFPTIIWAQTDWSLFLLRQASRRSWRIGQTEPVRVVITAYEGTMQQLCLQVLAEKLLAAEAIEGRFSLDGLQAMAKGSNSALRLAQALVLGLDDLPDLADAWRVQRGEDAAPDLAPKSIAIPVETRPPASADGGLVPWEHDGLVVRRRPRRSKIDPRQLTLFS